MGLHVSPDGRFVYASNRGHGSIAAIGFDKAANKLPAIGTANVAGAFEKFLTGSGRKGPSVLSSPTPWEQ